ncbi:MAG TPA: proton-conducting transporter membrane subunit, partial [Myxococcaceae bacterium]|nr:proton-conducting transporter membrane subunit [Myxococcaceae bacterium]
MRGEVLLLALVGLPLAVAVAVAVPRTRAGGLVLAPWAALPALGLAVVVGPAPHLEGVVPWLLVGVRLGMDETAWPFLLFTSLLWLAAGVYASGYLAPDARRHRFLFFFLAAMAGNLGLLAARDAVGFYAFYALMSFATYGLVVHPGGLEAERAARVYMVLAIFSEVLVLSGVLAATALAGGEYGLEALAAALVRAPEGPLVLGLLLAGFGVKVGVLLLHVWLPLAHSLAPTPASAVLSGAMIKAGLLGWMRVLPPGEVALPEPAEVLVGLGLAATFYGV